MPTTLWLLGVVISLLVGYLTGYVKKKGENRAIQEDLDNLVAQMSAVTTATKKIEAKISDEVWDRQKRWELKREVLFEAVKRIAEIDSSLLAVEVVVQLQTREKENDYSNEYHKAVMRYAKAQKALDETSLFVAILCANETNEAFQDLTALVNEIAIGINKKDTNIYRNSLRETAKALLAVRFAIQKELGINV